MVSAWNVGEVEEVVLPPCHYGFQCYVQDGKLSLMWNQRSCDTFLGIPFNIASYALLMTMVAQECGLEPGIFTHTLGDAHLYLNHLDGIRKQLERTPGALPQLEDAHKPLDEIQFEDIQVHNYEHAPFIKFEVAV